MGTAKKLRSNKGFTLVELVVVIAVLAILAGVGTVAYRGYITKANEAADVIQLAAIKTAADGAAAAADTPFVVTSIKVKTNTDGNVVAVVIEGTDSSVTPAAPKKITAKLADGKWSNDDFDLFMTGNTLTLKSETYKNGADWGATGWSDKDNSTLNLD